MVTTTRAPLPAEQVRSRVKRYALGFGIAGDDASDVVVEVYWPQAGGIIPVVWFALPGGAMNRHFYDLRDDGGIRFSFARQMAARGYLVVLVDLPGIGDSDRPVDGYTLTPDRVTGILRDLHERVCEDIRAGRMDEQLPGCDILGTIGVGHSMGATLTLCQQAAARSHVAVALLGFGLNGLPDYLSPEVRELAMDPAAVRTRLVELARQMFKVSYPEVPSRGNGEFYGSSGADRAAVRALRDARDRLLPVPAFLSMLPGNVKPEAAAIDVPVYWAFGEADFVDYRAESPDAFSAVPGVERKILPETGHSFFLFDTCEILFDSLSEWAGGFVQSGGSDP